MNGPTLLDNHQTRLQPLQALPWLDNGQLPPHPKNGPCVIFSPPDSHIDPLPIPLSHHFNFGANFQLVNAIKSINETVPKILSALSHLFLLRHLYLLVPNTRLPIRNKMNREQILELMMDSAFHQFPGDWEELLRRYAVTLANVSDRLTTFEIAGFHIVGASVYRKTIDEQR